MKKEAIDALLATFNASAKNPGNERVKALVHRIVSDLFYTIEDMDVSPTEFWTALSYLGDAGKSGELGLLAAGLGFEHFLDVRLDEAEQKAGMENGTPRTIEGPLYVAGAPESVAHARLDDSTDKGAPLLMQGRVLGEQGEPLANALVEVWHANHLGNYSHFDSAQAPFHLRRSIRTDADGHYSFHSVVPVGYSVPPMGKTQQLLDLLGRHGHRPAHIHFFVSAPGFRQLTTQINIDGDEYLWDDFAFATREGLVPALLKGQPEDGKRFGIDGEFVAINFDFKLFKERDAQVPRTEVERARVTA